MFRYTHGVADYDFTTPAFNQFDPPLTHEEMKAAADLVDSFGSKGDLLAWVTKNPDYAKGGTLSRLDLAVTVLSMQKGLIASAKELIPYAPPTKSGGNLYTKGAGNLTLFQPLSQGASSTPTPTPADVKALLDEADGYAATLKADGVLTEEGYQQLKNFNKGRGDWNLDTAKALRDAIKSMLDGHEAEKKGSSSPLFLVGGLALLYALSR